jgi:plasmid stabilization system protein ParE
MNFTVELSPKAEKELFEAVLWYESEGTGLGDRFAAEFLRKVSLIQSNPLHYPIKKGLHETKTDTFPYLLIYKIHSRKQIILITSVFHTSRHPRRKKR